MQNDNTQLSNAVAITGGIATGKSTVCSLFALYGFLIIDADKISHKLLQANSSEIIKLFGTKIAKDGIILRKKLGDIVFNDQKQKQILEDFLHPKIRCQIIQEAKIAQTQNKPYLIDIPLFFETNSYNIAKSIVVYAPKELQIKRLINRDNIDKKNAIIRIENQMDIQKKKSLATYMIDNSKDLRHLQNEVARIKELLLCKLS